MKIGFVGAGKVGFSMGKYLTERKVEVTGYYSRSDSSSAEAAEFTNTRQYLSLAHLVADSDVVLLSVPDGAIGSVWEQLKELPIQDKIIGHFSGSLSSAIFSDIQRFHAYGYSIHPLFAINNKYESYRDLSQALITVEGDPKYVRYITGLFEGCGNHVQEIGAEDKVRYHAAAAIVSNLYVGLASMGQDLLKKCGFSDGNAQSAMAPLMKGNLDNIIRFGPEGALTGPIERNDISTIENHLRCLDEDEQEVYRALSKQVVKVAQRKHPERDYSALKELL